MPAHFTVKFEEQTKALDVDIGELYLVDKTPAYEGDYELMPGTAEQVLETTNKRMAENVTVKAVTSEIDENIKAENIKSGVAILGVMGDYVTPFTCQEKSVVPTTEKQEVTADEGFDALRKVSIDAVTSAIDPNILPENIRQDVAILGVTGTMVTPTVNKLAQLAEGTLTELTAEDLEGCTKIAKQAFSNDLYLKSIEIPEGVKTINDYAFQNCAVLENAVLPDTVLTIGESCFRGCELLKINGLPKSLVNLKRYAFQNCTSITDVVIPKGARFSGYYVFQNCTGLKRVVFEEGYNASMSSYAFSGCTNLSDVTLVEGVTTIPDSCFSNCTSLKKIDIPTTVLAFYSSAFYNTGIEEIVIPMNTSIGTSNIFRNCKSLKSVTFVGYNANNNASIGSYVFMGCTALTSLTIPEKMRTIGSNALNIGSAENKATIIMLSETPPTIAANTFDSTTLDKIIVPAGCGEVYKTATNWAAYADYIEEATA